MDYTIAAVHYSDTDVTMWEAKSRLPTSLYQTTALSPIACSTEQCEHQRVHFLVHPLAGFIVHKAPDTQEER